MEAWLEALLPIRVCGALLLSVPPISWLNASQESSADPFPKYIARIDRLFRTVSKIHHCHSKTRDGCRNDVRLSSRFSATKEQKPQPGTSREQTSWSLTCPA